MYDLLVKGARIIDGTGAPSWTGDIAVKSGRIVAMGRLEGEAARTIQANGLVASPGFVDIHPHSDLSFMWTPRPKAR
jgi:N-acyl-D-aspartate/D-glutamate deacylase